MPYMKKKAKMKLEAKKEQGKSGTGPGLSKGEAAELDDLDEDFHLACAVDVSAMHDFSSQVIVPAAL